MTVIYHMSIDRADKPWIGDRRLTEYCTPQHGEKGVLAPPEHNRLRNVCPLVWRVRVPLVFPRP